jgi:Ca2+-binding RTX toxin-like protein
MSGLLFAWQNQRVSTARAYGLLSVDLGVPSGEPIFVVNNMMPGDCEIRNISVTNGDTTPQELAVRSDNESETNNLPAALRITITRDTTELYNNTVEQFFIDSQTLDGISLQPINPSETQQYVFEVCFDTSAGNEYQNGQTIFDLIFGEIISPLQLPAECAHLKGIITQKIEGTSKKDKIRGTSANELIIGNGGNDELDGGSGRDCVVGGDGNDDLDGGSQDDVVLGMGGNDKMKGGSGGDKIYGGDGNDKIDGGSGNDFIYGEQGNDKIEGGSGNDMIDAGLGNDRIKGDSGTDTCVNGENITSCEL